MASKVGSAFLKGMKDSLAFVAKGNGFDRLLKGCQIVEGAPGRCVVSYTVTEGDLNKGGTMHGGFGATLVDVVTTIALADPETGYLLKPGVSIDLGLSYMNAAKPGEDILIDARVIKSGRSLAFMDCEIRKKDDGKIILRGTHTKFVGGESFNKNAAMD